MMGEALILSGQLVGTAFACGLNLYATVALLGIASRLGWITALPPELLGLQHGLVIATAAVLFLVEFVIDKIPFLDSIWDTIHTFIRPVAAVLLALTALTALPAPAAAAVAIAAGLVALAAHAAKAGLRLALNSRPGHLSNISASLAEDIVAVTVVVVSFRNPTAALAIAAGAIGLVALFGALLWRAFTFGVRAIIAWQRGFFAGRRWHAPADMPAALRALLAPPDPGRGEPRALRAAISGFNGIGAYRNGWLVLDYADLIFLYRSHFRARRLELPRARFVRLERRALADLLVLAVEPDREFTLFLLKDGPPPDAAIVGIAPLPA